jgi:hypothetical protein
VSRVLGKAHEARANGVEVHIRHAPKKGSVIEQRLKSEPAFPETTGAVIFTIRASGQRLVDATHEPAYARKPTAPLAQRRFVDSAFGNREEPPPALSHFLIRPACRLLVCHAQYDVIVIMHDGVREDFDRECGSKLGQSILNPLPSMLEIFSREPILAA